MNIIPAIDLIGNQCVRLTQGDYTQKKVYSNDPVQVARQFESQGASTLHIVDLEGAKEGRPIHSELILKIRQSVAIPIQVGGGIRTLETAALYIDAGIDRIIIGTRALENDFLQKLLDRFGSNRIVVGLDLREGKIATNGWLKTTDQDYLEFAKSLKKMGVVRIMVTDIARDGMLASNPVGAGRDRPLQGLQSLGLKIIAAGGISTITDLKELAPLGIEGAIIGKALYERRDAINRVPTLRDFLAAAQLISSLAKRIIPCMDIQDGRVVKGTHFKNLKDAGDPVELAQYYSAQGADELVFLDITATIKKRGRGGRFSAPTLDLVRRIAEKINIPFCVGGGISTLDDIQALLQAGADKISIGSAAVLNPDFVRQAADRFGSQCIVVSIDAKKRRGYGSAPTDTNNIKNRRRRSISSPFPWSIYTHGGSQETGIDAISFAQQMERYGAGELLINSLDRDGTQTGYDLDLLRAIATRVTIPVIASSGAGSLRDFSDAIIQGRCDAVLAASLFHSGALTVAQVKKYLAEQGIKVRIPNAQWKPILNPLNLPCQGDFNSKKPPDKGVGGLK